jgi:FkbM family methyltransferase
MFVNFSEIPQKSAVGRILRLPLRILPKGMVVPILQGRLRGKEWVVGSANNGCWLGSYEYETQRAFARAVKEGFTVFDVGAQAGFYTLLASDLVGAKGKVVAFEPVPRNLRYLKEHLRRNAVVNVSVVEAAVSDHSGFAFFAEDEKLTEGRLAVGGRLRVRTVSLDELVCGGELPPPDCIKMDIQGGEVPALRGAVSILSERGPIIFLETHGDEIHRECCRLLASLRYQLAPVGEASLDRANHIVAFR